MCGGGAGCLAIKHQPGEEELDAARAAASEDGAAEVFLSPSFSFFLNANIFTDVSSHLPRWRVVVVFARAAALEDGAAEVFLSLALSLSHSFDISLPPPLKYEPSSEPLHISAKLLFLN